MSAISSASEAVSPRTLWRLVAIAARIRSFTVVAISPHVLDHAYDRPAPARHLVQIALFGLRQPIPQFHQIRPALRTQSPRHGYGERSHAGCHRLAGQHEFVLRA